MPPNSNQSAHILCAAQLALQGVHAGDAAAAAPAVCVLMSGLCSRELAWQHLSLAQPVKILQKVPQPRSKQQQQGGL